MIDLPNIPSTDEDLYGKEKTVEAAQEQYIIFRLNAEWYGIKSREIREVIKLERLTPLPSVPAYIVGITNLRGTILPVIHLKRALGLRESAEHSGDRLLVIETESFEIACLVDEINEVATIPVSALEPPLLTLETKVIDFIENTCQWSQQFFAIIKVGKLISLISTLNQPTQSA